eukprot:NODE_4172_length_1105_cov_50.312627_g3974_i0.p1 GENE.NODE_4172_length_1105_cov_50.312627_g3974_i0~~NODE_4172_length_1105_cov_50.312627_g3974_i0.p1  ORF type:complete len:302 (-),score=54.15 NODE_4172_length_1105_cov_50.312627_g3974_i0:140-1045(-)
MNESSDDKSSPTSSGTPILPEQPALVMKKKPATKKVRLGQPEAPPDPPTPPPRITKQDACCHEKFQEEAATSALEKASFLPNALTRRALTNALVKSSSRPYATSIHLFGTGVEGTMWQAVELINKVTTTCAQCMVMVEGLSTSIIMEEVYAAGRQCPCGVVVFDDIEKLDSDTREAVFKALFDDKPALLLDPSRVGKDQYADSDDRGVDVSQMIFVIMTHKTHPSLDESLPKLLAMENSNAALHALGSVSAKAVKAMELWPDRVTHVIRHHIPIVASAKTGGVSQSPDGVSEAPFQYDNYL